MYLLSPLSYSHTPSVRNTQNKLEKINLPLSSIKNCILHLKNIIFEIHDTEQLLVSHKKSQLKVNIVSIRTSDIWKRHILDNSNNIQKTNSLLVQI